MQATEEAETLPVCNTELAIYSQLSQTNIKLQIYAYPPFLILKVRYPAISYVSYRDIRAIVTIRLDHHDCKLTQV